MDDVSEDLHRQRLLEAMIDAEDSGYPLRRTDMARKMALTTGAVALVLDQLSRQGLVAFHLRRIDGAGTDRGPGYLVSQRGRAALQPVEAAP